MTVAASQARLLSLTLYKSDLEYRLMSISQNKQILGLQSSAYATAYAEACQAAGTDPDMENDPYMLAIQQKEKAYDAEQKTLETQQQAAAAELDTVQKLVENNVKKEFKLNLGS